MGKSPQRKSRNVPSLITTLLAKKNDGVTDSTSTGNPYADQNPQSVACWHLNMLKKIKQVRGDPYWWIQKRSMKLISEYQDCHMQLRKKQKTSEFKRLNNVYKPFSKNTKEMIRELGNVELFDLCETTPKVQCSQCLLYWNQGIVDCTCGQGLIEIESSRKFHKLWLDALSIPTTW